MRDTGLNDAIAAAGGIGALARKIGIAQPSLSKWTRVPAERVVAVETATGIDRSILRPDLYGAAVPSADAVDDVDAARAQEYALLATLLARAPDGALLQRLSRLTGDDSLLGQAHAALAEGATQVTAEAVEREYHDLFIGVGRGEFLPYASYYLTGFLYERPLANLRGHLARLGLERAVDQSEPEDHIAILCEIMSGLAGGRYVAAKDADRELFEAHLSPWAPRLFKDLERAERADFYRHVGKLGRVFMDIETEAFTLPS
ncbi:MAG: molecular chaperone [Alphaproteobacteria bacterium]|nr:molecular chaperone [Alphaproteobacteria bacterium]